LIGDSVDFIKEQLGSYFKGIDLCYLDSWDVDWTEPYPSAVHGLAEFKQLLPFLVSGSLILIDDTPAGIEYVPEGFQASAQLYENQYGCLPGKGSLILQEISKHSNEFEVLHHEYNLLIRKK
jgi:hypothetical protein